MNQLPSHLGGSLNKTHVDKGALSWLIQKYNIKSFLDIGCGPGGMVELAKKLGLRSQGIDGDFTLGLKEPEFLIHDFTLGAPLLKDEFDLGWSCEFVEHVEEKYMNNYFYCFKQCKKVVITYAPPGWPGIHHVNCQTEDYWKNKFFKYGFTYDENATLRLREVSTQLKPFVKSRGLIFNNEI
jgi:SAM-dependent methyltransferase